MTTLTSRAAVVAERAKTWPGVTRVSGHYGKARQISGSSTISEHSYGNALDIFGSRDGLESLALFLDQNKQAYQIRLICYDPGPGRKYGKCTTKHTDHIHLDFSPNCGGHVDPNGTATETAKRCDDYQKGQPVNDQINPDTGLVGTPAAEGTGGLFGGITDAIKQGVSTIALVGLGAVLVVAGVVIIVKDSKAFNAAKSAVTGVVTKGVVK